MWKNGPLCENMTQSTKPEVHKTTQPQPQTQLACTEKLVKFGRVVSRYRSRQANRQTPRQTDRQTDRQMGLSHFAVLQGGAK